MDLEKTSEMLKALGHPMRLKIVLGILEKNECNVNTMVTNLKIPQSTVSQHLGILRSKGVLSFHKKGTEVCYMITDDSVRKIIENLK